MFNMSWIRGLHEGLIEWLLEKDNPSVRFWTLQRLLDYQENDDEVLKAQDMIMESHTVKEILRNQEPDGFWVHEHDMYLPKYKATTHQLLILSELGCKRISKIEKAVEQVFRFQRLSGHFLTKLPKTEKGRASKIIDHCCLDGNNLSYMLQFGYLEDIRVQKLIDFLVTNHRGGDAGWKCRAYPINPDGVFPVNCYMGAVKVLKGLSHIPKKNRSNEVKQIIKREVENVLENGVYRYLRNPDGSRKDKAGWKRFRFPMFYQSDVLEVLGVLTNLGIKDSRMEDSIGLVESLQGKDGKWVLMNTFNGKMWVDIEKKKQPSKWITLKALFVLKGFYEG